jgi:hypothetical protein
MTIITTHSASSALSAVIRLLYRPVVAAPAVSFQTSGGLAPCQRGRGLLTGKADPAVPATLKSVRGHTHREETEMTLFLRRAVSS